MVFAVVVVLRPWLYQWFHSRRGGRPTEGMAVDWQGDRSDGGRVWAARRPPLLWFGGGVAERPPCW